jgi:hypothetical protein
MTSIKETLHKLADDKEVYQRIHDNGEKAGSYFIELFGENEDPSKDNIPPEMMCEMLLTLWVLKDAMEASLIEGLRDAGWEP